MKVLVTSGGTREPIDGVRFITNFSTGATGAFLADHFRRLGWDVTYLGAEDARVPQLAGETVRFSDFNSLEQNLKRLLGSQEFDAIIHLAAVSDFSVASLLVNNERLSPQPNTKIDSGVSSFSVELKKNPKLIGLIRKYSKNREIRIVGFKLTQNASEEDRLKAVANLFSSSQPDLVVQNDLSEIRPPDQHVAKVYSSDGVLVSTNTRDELARRLSELLLKGKSL